MVKQLTCTDVSSMAGCTHWCRNTDIFVCQKNPISKIGISTTEEEEQKILHMLYCNIVGHAAGDTTNVARLNTRNGINHVKENFYANKLYLCKDFHRVVCFDE